jgi:hypothetical protein
MEMSLTARATRLSARAWKACRILMGGWREHRAASRHVITWRFRNRDVSEPGKRLACGYSAVQPPPKHE